MLEAFAASHPKLYLAVLIIASLFVLVKSSDLLLYGIIKWAKHLGLSDYIVGLFIIGIVASFPELVSALTGAMIDQPGLTIGTILGSNICGLSLVLGIMALIGRKLNIKSKLFNKVKLTVLMFTILPVLLLIDGTLSRLDGVILIASYLCYIGYLWYKEGQMGELKKNVNFKDIWKHGVVFLLALVALLLSGRWLVFGSVELAKQFNISPFIIGTFLLGLVGQLPDLLVIIRSELQGHKDIGMGDLLGSTITKSLLFLGIIVLIKPLTLPFNTVLISGIALLVVMALVLNYMREGWITWKGGLIMLLIYLMFMFIELI